MDKDIQKMAKEAAKNIKLGVRTLRSLTNQEEATPEDKALFSKIEGLAKQDMLNPKTQAAAQELLNKLTR